MNILQVTPRYPPQSGGVETHVKEISERLADRGHDVTVLTADAGEEGRRRERQKGVQIKRYRSIAPNNAIHFSPQLFAAVRTTESDIVHAHNYYSFPLVFTALGAGDRRFVVTPHYHGGSASSIRDRLLSVYRPFGEGQCGAPIYTGFINSSALPPAEERENLVFHDLFGDRLLSPLVRQYPMIRDFCYQFAWQRLPELTEYDVLRAYEENLDLVLGAVVDLLESIGGRTVVTSDHGNLVGERLPLFFRRFYRHPAGLYAPGPVEVPWFIVEGNTRREIVAGDTSESDEITVTESTKEKLEFLRYR